MIYLAAPIDAVDPDLRDDVRGARREAIRALTSHGLAVFDPATATHGGMNDPQAVYQLNDSVLERARGLMALVPPGVPSVGVPQEILRAKQLQIPVAVVGGHSSMQLKGMEVALFGDIRQAAAQLASDVQYWKSYTRAIKWTGDPEFCPRTGYAGDAGFDLYVAEDTTIVAGGWADVPHGVSIELPSDCWAMIHGRSSSWRKRRVRIEHSIIDQGYRGPLFAAVQNIGDMPVTLKRGERVAQIIPMPLTAQTVYLKHVDELGPSERGVRAFGSSDDPDIG